MNEKLLNESYPAQEVSDDLRLRVKRLAARSDDARAARNRRRSTVRRGALIATAAGVLGGAVILAPKIATAREVWRVQSALGKLKSAHIVQWQRSENGGRETMETWFSGDSARIESHGGVQIFTGGANYFYNPQRKTVVRRRAEGPAMYNSSGFTLDAIKNDLTGGLLGAVTSQRLDNIVENGRTLKRVAFFHAEPAGTIRTLLLVDPATDLPTRFETALSEKKAWTPIGGGELRYNESLSARLFSPMFPGARLTDADAEKARWSKKIEGVVGEARLGERTVKIRDVQVNSQGAIFVLYTCDKAWDDGMVLDEKGGWWPDSARDWDLRIPGYSRQKMHFGDYYNLKEKSRGSIKRPVLDDGGRLQGDWFIPLAKNPALTKTVTLNWAGPVQNFHGEALARESRTEYGTDLTPQERRLSDIPALTVADRFELHRGWSERATVTVHPAPLANGFAPEYWPYLIEEYLGGEELDKKLQKHYDSARETLYADNGVPGHNNDF